jgi:hypothetical protein
MPEMMENSLTEADARERDAIDSKSIAKDVLQPPDKAMDHAWRYFALHAQQRMSVFNFFVVLSGILSTGIAAGLQGGKPTLVTATLGALLAIFAFVFRRLDRRGAQFVKLAEDALVAGEACCVPDYARVFSLEHAGTPAGTWTFGRSFRLIFAVMAIAGLGACLFSIYRIAT